MFSNCFQKVRNQAGPFKIFGSREVEAVGSCMHHHLDVFQKTEKEIDSA